MLKYTTKMIVFREVPGEITLSLNISGCPLKCHNCHSPELREDIGIPLTPEELQRLIDKNKGISCVCFMGGLNDICYLNILAPFVRKNNLKTAVYLGCEELPKELNRDLFNYIKIGPYKEEFGPLDNPNTNQRMYKIEEGNLIDITYKFWKNDNDIA